MGGSAGAVEGFRRIVRAFPADLQAAVFIVLHIPMDLESMLPRILSRVGPLPATHPMDGEPIQPGHIYVAPPDRQLTMQGGVVRVRRGPRESRNRPALEPVFRPA